MSVPRSRILDLMKARCKIFNTTFNPEGLRLGNKILRQRLKGPALAAYYPRRMVTLKDITSKFPEWEFMDDAEEERQDGLRALHARGKTLGRKRNKKGDGKKK